MAKQIITAIVLLCFITTTNAQKQLDASYMECSYKFTQMVDTVTKKKITKDPDMRLLIGNKYSKFYSYTNFLSDSVILSKSYAEQESLFENNAAGIIEHNKQYPSGDRHVIYKNYAENLIISTDLILSNGSRVLCKEPIPKQNWTILNETKQIAGYKCQKATCRFRGRDYVAWFTREITVNEGPHKFSGLPGLVVKIYDTKEHYDFELYSVKKIKKEIIFDQKNYQEVNLKDYVQMKKNDVKNPFAGQQVTFRRNDGTEFTPQRLYDVMERDTK